MAKAVDLTMIPKTLNDLSKEFMYEYTKKNGAEGDELWIAKLFVANRTTYKRGDKEINAYDLKPIRKAFAEKFFPDLLKPKKNTVSFHDQMLAIIAAAEGKK